MSLGNKKFEQQLDSMFKNTLDNAEFDAPNGVWENIAHSISTPSTPNPSTTLNNSVISGISTVTKTVILVSTALIVGTSIYLFNSSDETAENKFQKSESVIINNNAVVEDEKENKPNQVETHIESFVNEETENINPDYQTSKNSNQHFEKADVKRENNQVNENINNKSNDKLEDASVVQSKEIIKDEFINNPETNHKDALLILPDTVLCLSPQLDKASIFNGLVIENIEIFERENRIQNLSVEYNNLWLLAKAEYANGQKIQRRFKINSSSISVEVSNVQKGAVLCKLLNGNQFGSIEWYINNELIDVDLNEIVYYRNVESTNEVTTTLMVKAFGQNACMSLYSKEISDYFVPKNDFMIPTVITPNNDGLNDKWIIDIQGTTLFNAKVYGSESTIIFQTNDINNQWDGTDLHGNDVPGGAYIYIINYQLPNEDIQTKTGIIQLIRN